MPEIRSISDSLDSCYKTISAILNIFGIELLPLDLSHFMKLLYTLNRNCPSNMTTMGNSDL